MPRKNMARVVSDVCGIQAQVLSASELAIRARVVGVRQEDVRDALWKDRILIKTWCMRGTLHLLTSTDFPLYVAALRSKLAETEKWLERVERVTSSEFSSITEKISEVLSDEPQTREELSEAVERGTFLSRRTRRVLRSAWGVLLRPAAYRGFLAFGESTGPKATFIRPPGQARPSREMSERDAIVELFRRYLRCYGPATVGDFGHWWGDAREVKQLLGPSLVEFEQIEVDGFRGLMLARDAEEARGMSPARQVCLLPAFDCYPMFYAPRDLFVPAAHRSRIFRQTAGWNYPTLVVNGLAAGIWGMKKSSKRLVITVEPFRSLAEAEKRLIQDEGADISRFLNTAVEVRYGKVG